MEFPPENKPEPPPEFGGAAHWPLAERKINVQSRKKRDRTNENFRKRWQTLAKLGWELKRDYGADCYFSVHWRNKDFVYRSRDSVLPLLADTIVRAYSLR